VTRGLNIDQEVACRLRWSGYLALRDVSCGIRGGVLSLHGRLPTHYLKQVAQAIAVEVEGVSSVVNRIDVVASTPGAISEGTKPCACPTSR
jgi:osmotically-inducible protein OsmY